jgi:hypothetical protein
VTVLFHIDNEAPDFGDWDGVETDCATIAQAPGASLPGSGGVLGLRMVGGDSPAAAYAFKTLPALAPGSTRYVGTFIRMNSTPGADEKQVLIELCGTLPYARIKVHAGNEIYSSWFGWVLSSGHATLEQGRWYYLVLAVKRATTPESSDGQVRFYLDGVQIHASGVLNNYDHCAGTGQVRVGYVGTPYGDDFVANADMDEAWATDDQYPTPPGDPPSGRYEIYRGVHSAAAIDWDSPVANAPAGTAQAVLAGLGHQVGVDYYYGLRAVSDAGVQEQGTAAVCRVVIDGDGNLAGNRPNAVAWASASPYAGGKIVLAFEYDAEGERAEAAGLELAEVRCGQPDWTELLQTISFSGSVRRQVLLETVWEHQATVRLAVRAVDADGAAGEALTLAPVAADAEAPAEVAIVSAQAT